jgi:AcrR family transcriptional regulator
MPRPRRYETDALLDAAARILAAEGPAAVTMSAVARVTGAPSGSMYHRFPTRAALCGQLWLRTLESFHAGLMAALAESSDPREACVAAARFTVRWCREAPILAEVLLVGADALGRDDWPPDVIVRHEAMQQDLDEALAVLRRPGDGDRLALAVIDVPCAVVRRHLHSGTDVPADAEDIVEVCARALVPAGLKTVGGQGVTPAEESGAPRGPNPALR